MNTLTACNAPRHFAESLVSVAWFTGLGNELWPWEVDPLAVFALGTAAAFVGWAFWRAMRPNDAA